MTTAALQAGVGWEFLAAADREPFRARWTAAQARVRSVLGYPIEDLLRTPRAERYREQLREMARRAREAYERAAGGRGTAGGGSATGPEDPDAAETRIALPKGGRPVARAGPPAIVTQTIGGWDPIDGAATIAR